MSEDSSKNSIKHKQKWGFLAAVFGGVLVFFGSQYISVGIISAFDLPFEGQEVLQNTFIYALATTIMALLLAGVLKMFSANFKDLGLNKPKLLHLGYALAALPIYFIVTALLGTLASIVFPQIDFDQAQETGFDSVVGTFEVIAVFFSLVVLPPLIEEMLFRGFIFRGLMRSISPVFAAILTSLIFGLAHQQWNVAIDTFALSLILCYMVYKTNSLWPAIFLHGIKNFIAFMLLFIIDISDLNNLNY